MAHLMEIKNQIDSIFAVNGGMDKKGPIVLIEDDEDDLRLLIEVFADLNLTNEVHLFKNPDSVISFLQRPEINPFLIISDINMPMMNGFQIRDLLQNDPLVNHKRIPYLFFSTVVTLTSVSGSQNTSFQGIFKKPIKQSDWKQTIETIVRYWSMSLPPETYQI
jgi:CheY-like chemotaxis protein